VDAGLWDGVDAALAAERPGQVMLERLVLDGDVEEGTGLVVQGTFLVWGSSAEALREHAAALRARLPAAEWQEERLYEGVRPDAAVTAAVAGAFRAAGRSFVADGEEAAMAIARVLALASVRLSEPV
jgi:hypothetical protein